MMVKKITRNKLLQYSILLVLIMIFENNVVCGQEKHMIFKEYTFKNVKLSNFIYSEIKQIRKKSSELKYVIINYNKSRNQLKMSVMNKFDFSEVLMLFQEGIVGFLFRNGITIVVFGDSRIFLKETFKYVKIDKYKTYYKRILLKNSRKAEKQGLVDFPLNRDPLSFFYKIDNDEFIYIKSDMVLVVDNNWL